MSSALRCPQCGVDQSRTVDSRSRNKFSGQVYKHNAVRRRRECVNGHRFTTYERVEENVAYESSRQNHSPFHALAGQIVSVLLFVFACSGCADRWNDSTHGFAVTVRTGGIKKSVTGSQVNPTSVDDVKKAAAWAFNEIQAERQRKSAKKILTKATATYRQWFNEANRIVAVEQGRLYYIDEPGDTFRQYYDEGWSPQGAVDDFHRDAIDKGRVR